MTYQHPDKIAIYAAALDSDINVERFQLVVDSKLETFWIGTVYGGGVATKRGYKFKTPEEAWSNASEFVECCAEILSKRAQAKEGGE
ncbi:MAG: hypothetical protein WBC18_20430 [Ottowia sp.]|uniref:hypothetical protein n=1 Tax=Ottowia sp. TaxID=1898956 RepID=UPI003C72A0A7